MARNKGKEVCRTPLAGIVSKSPRITMTQSNIKAGFHMTGIYPLNRAALDKACGPSKDLHMEVDADSEGAETIMQLS